MRVNFRQGIVSHSISGNLQAFLSQAGTGGDVGIVADNTPVIVNFAHKATNYSFSENASVVAWLGPFDSSTDYYLYWDIDTVTAQRTFGYTTVPPIVSSSEPVGAQPNTHWYNSATNQMSYIPPACTSFSEVIRVFACKLENGNNFISMGDSTVPGAFTGTQAGNNGSVLSGRIVFDQTNNPIARRDVPGTFFTTEDPVFSAAALVDAIRLESNVYYAKSSESAALSALQIVSVQLDGTVQSALYEDVGSTVVGVITEDTLLNETSAVVLQGVVTNPLWAWSTVGIALYVDNGLLVEVDPHLSNVSLHPQPQVPVARVLRNDTVIFEQGLGGIGEQGPPGALEEIPPATTVSIGGAVLTTPPVNPAIPLVASDTDPRLSDARVPLPHTHIASNITVTPGGGVISNNVQGAIVELGNGKVDRAGDTMTGFLTLNANPVDPLHAATKNYVDALVSGLIWIDPVLYVNLIDDSLNTPPVSPENADAYVVAIGGTGAWTGLSGRLVVYDAATLAWLDQGPITAFPVGSRFGLAMETPTATGGTFVGRETDITVLGAGPSWTFISPILNNAIYVNNANSLHAFHQYAFDGIKWVEFGGGQVGAGLNLVINGNLIDVQNWSVGGTIDAATLQGNAASAFALVGHTHAFTAADIANVPAVASGIGTPAAAENLTGTDVQLALDELLDEKAARTPLYADLVDLPSAASVSGMLVVVTNESRPYFSFGGIWVPIMTQTEPFSLPYDMAFFISGFLQQSKTVGSFTITRPVTVGVNAPGSIAIADIAATDASYALEIVHRPGPGFVPTIVGTITFAVGINIGTIVWLSAINFVAGDLLQIRTDGVTAIDSTLLDITTTIVGCATSNQC